MQRLAWVVAATLGSLWSSQRPMGGMLRPAALGSEPDGQLTLTSPTRVCASRVAVADTLTMPAVGRLMEGSILPPGSSVLLAITEAHVSRGPSDPIRLSFAIHELRLPSGERVRLAGAVASADVERARLPFARFDACIPAGGHVVLVSVRRGS